MRQLRQNKITAATIADIDARVASLPSMLTVKDLPALSGGQSIEYWNKLRVTGGGPPFAKFGKSVKYPTREFFEWMYSKVQHSTSA